MQSVATWRRVTSALSHPCATGRDPARLNPECDIVKVVRTPSWPKHRRPNYVVFANDGVFHQGIVLKINRPHVTSDHLRLEHEEVAPELVSVTSADRDGWPSGAKWPALEESTVDAADTEHARMIAKRPGRPAGALRTAAIAGYSSSTSTGIGSTLQVSGSSGT